MKWATGFVCLATMTMAWANAQAQYNVRINNPAVVAGTELKTGDYRVEITGDKAMIHGKKDTVEASVKVEEGNQKFSSTTVQYSMSGGKYRIDEIHLGGTKTKVVFNN
jgi:hypothetical protein